MTLSVIITGAGDSVGRVIAETFVSRGAKVHICDVREDVLMETLTANPAMRGTVADVSDAQQVATVFAEAARHISALTTLVNCVGIGGPRGLIDELVDAEWRRTFDINVHGTFYTMQHAIPLLRAQGGGAIINFSTGSTRTRLPSRTAYIASKFALEGLTLNAARELGPSGIRCNAILPGIINNARMRNIMAQRAAAEGIPVEAIEDEYLRYVSSRAMTSPLDLAEMVYFLASDAGLRVTGELIAVSGNLEWEG